MLPNAEQTPVLTIEEAASVLRISRSAAYAAASRGDLPVLRIGRALRVPTAQLVSMLSDPLASPPGPSAAADLPTLRLPDTGAPSRVT